MQERYNDQQLHQLLAENMSDLVCLHDPDGMYRWVSPSVKRILGYEPDSLIGTDPYQLFHNDDRETIQTNSHEPAKSGSGNILVRYRIRHSDGHYIWFETLTQPITNNTGKVSLLHTTSREVTHQVELEQALAKSEALYHSVVDAMAEGVVVVDENGNILANNSQFNQILGLNNRQLSGRNVAEARWDTTYLNGQSMPVEEHPIIKSLATGTPYRNIIAGIRHAKLEERRWYSINSQPVRIPSGSESEAAVVASFEDVSEQIGRESELRLWSVVYQQSNEAIAIAGANGVIREVNQAFLNLTKTTRDRFIGAPAKCIVDNTEYEEVVNETVLKRARAQGIWRGDLSIRDSDGEAHPLWASVSYVSSTTDTENLDGYYIFILSNIKDRQLKEADLIFSATHDILTGLPNRALLADRFDSAIRTAHNEQKPFGCLYLDIDGFKPVNDNLGHTVGDKLLEAVAHRLLGVLRDNDTLARIGGDEFFIISENQADLDTLNKVCQRIINALRQPFNVDNHDATVGVSIGVSLYPDSGYTPEQLMDAADRAMYQAKRKGGNCCVFSDPKSDGLIHQ